MRIAHLSDLHVTEGPRLEDQRETLEGIVDDALALDPHLWILAGDLYGRTVPHRSTPAERGVLFPAIVRMARHAPVVVIYGNHDHDPDLDGLAHLDGEWPIRVVKTAERFSVDTMAGRAQVYAMPYLSKRWILAGQDPPRSLADAQARVEKVLGDLLQVWTMQIRSARATRPRDAHLLVAHLQVAGSMISGGEVLAGQEIELTRAQLEGLPVDYGALGHLHLRQEPALRCWYPGSPWRNDFGETDPKGWNLVEVDPQDLSGPGVDDYPAQPDRLHCRVTRIASTCRHLVTLDYRWASEDEEGTPRWMARPDQIQLDLVQQTRAEVRMRLVCPEQWIASCPWVEEVERVRALGAVRMTIEKKIEPVYRVRAPAVAAARSDVDKVQAFWGTLATPPNEAEQAAALACLQELLTTEDEEVARTTQRLLA